MTKIILISIVMIITFITQSSGSAIPMWEYLSRGEKMSHLYSMFAKQVSSYCKVNTDLPVAQCKRDLLVYGVSKLEKMSDSYLDTMDPYQRGANDIIWDSMMSGHALNQNKEKTTTETSIREPNGEYEHNPLFDNDNDNSAGAFDDYTPSTKKPTTSPVTKHKNKMDNTYSSYQSYLNGYPSAFDSLYNDPPNYLPQETNINFQYDESPSSSLNTNYLSGPMVVRVRPDGTPVDEDRKKPLPRDDDREAMTIGKIRIPTIQQITDSFSILPRNSIAFTYRPTIMTSPFGNMRRTLYSSYPTGMNYDRRMTNSH